MRCGSIAERKRGQDCSLFPQWGWQRERSAPPESAPSAWKPRGPQPDPYTRIMIPLRFGSTVGFEGAEGHQRGDVFACQLVAYDRLVWTAHHWQHWLDRVSSPITRGAARHRGTSHAERDPQLRLHARPALSGLSADRQPDTRGSPRPRAWPARRDARGGSPLSRQGRGGRRPPGAERPGRGLPAAQ
jgi:hypothetical protein